MTYYNALQIICPSCNKPMEFSRLEDALAFLRNCTRETLHKAVEQNEKVQAAIKELPDNG